MLKHIFAVSCMLLPVLSSRSDDKRKEPSPYTYGCAKGQIEITGELLVTTNKGEKEKKASLRIGSGGTGGFRHFPLEWSDAPELWEQAQKLNGKWVVVTGTFEIVVLDASGSGFTMFPVKVKTLKEAPAPKDK